MGAQIDNPHRIVHVGYVPEHVTALLVKHQLQVGLMMRSNRFQYTQEASMTA
ncbi:hypothetical protein [Cupriavidus necator]|nr:hypothetical protein [Cupriavidus necator]MDX6008618.1 hypothetical protein [Cupriavidus necator]